MMIISEIMPLIDKSQLIFLAESKIDLGDIRKVYFEESLLISKSYEIPLFQTSSLTGFGITEMFMNILAAIIENDLIIKNKAIELENSKTWIQKADENCC